MPVRVTTPGGAVVSLDSAQHRGLYEGWHFAPARVEGGWVFVSGIVAVAGDSVPIDSARLAVSFRRAWRAVRARLEAAGSSTADIVDLTSYHVFGSAAFSGTKDEHIRVFRRVKDEFVPAPYPTWTGVGVAELFPDGGLVEIRVIARLRATGRAP